MSERNQRAASGTGSIRIAALLIGFAIAAQGVFGLVAPDAFFSTIAFMQAPPALYVAAVVRMAFGVILFRAARESRAPVFLRAFGALVTIGGALTPFLGARFASAILQTWSVGGPGVVRSWAAGSVLLGLLIVLAVSPWPRGAAARKM